MRRPINWRIVLSNVTEAREELQQLEAIIADRTRRSRESLEVSLSHAYHHLNYAWRVKHVPTSRYARLTNAEFNRWGEFPKDVWLPRIEPARRSERRRKRSA